MTRLISFTLKFAIFIGVIVLAVWLADAPGTARIIWYDYVIETSAAFLGVCILIFAFIVYFLLRLWRFIRNGPAMWRLQRKINKLHEGQSHITEGLIAVAAGNAAEAGRHAVGARKFLGTTPITKLLQAQAAQLAGDRTTAREIFLSLAADSNSAVLGYRGLIMEALRSRNWEEAGKLAEKLRRLKPETPWLNLIRFELSARQRQWGEAGAALSHVAAARLMEPALTKQHQAAVLLATIADEQREGRPEKALHAAERAKQLSPSWLPAIIALSQQHMAAGHKRAARRTIERAWNDNPHPQLARLYRTNSGETEVKAYKQVEYLCRTNEDLPVSRIALAEAALAADIWGEARRHLLALENKREMTQGAYRLLAQLERKESGNERAATLWLTRAIDAPPDPTWLCRNCGGTHEEWQPLCCHCGAFDTLDWQTPGQSHASSSEPAALLTTWAS